MVGYAGVTSSTENLHNQPLVLGTSHLVAGSGSGSSSDLKFVAFLRNAGWLETFFALVLPKLYTLLPLLLPIAVFFCLSVTMTNEITAAIEELRREIRQELKDFRESFQRNMRKEFREIRNSVNFMNKQYEEMMGHVKAVRGENLEIKSCNERLQTKCEELTKRLMLQEARIVQCEQYSRHNNLEFKGIPVTANENLEKLLETIGQKVGERIEPADVGVAHRVPVANNTVEKNLIVQFVRRTKRNAVLEKSRHARLNSRELRFSSPVPVYRNEHLCPELKRLLGQAVAKKKEVNWRFVWVRNGQILA